MKSIALSAALLFSAITPLSTAVAAPAPAPVAATQSMVEYLGSFEYGGNTYDVFLVTDLGGGWY
ncbi:MAG TPA: hypothetical protein VF782_00925 [Allosphingosinicella sp.]|jgi:hypothetical protein